MEELRDEDVYLEHVGDVLALHVAQHVDEPLEVLVRRTDPQEVYLRDRCRGFSIILSLSFRDPMDTNPNYS